MSFLRIGLAALQMTAADAAARLMAWLPIPIQALEPCIPSRKARQHQPQVWFLADQHIVETRCNRMGLRSWGGQGTVRLWGSHTNPNPSGFPRPAPG